MMKKLTYLLLCLIMGIGIVSAQTTSVRGVVLSAEDNEPIIGASVLAKGTTVGTITNLDGEFSLDIPSSAKVLVISYIGMATQEVAVAPNLRVLLESDTQTLDEVVVTAQGLSRKEKSLGYSTQKVTGEKLTVARQTDLGNAMAGKIAGARFFGKSGSTFDSGKIVLRGSTSFTSPEGSEPIYVVDGSISNKDAVNMDDVESINVLKGAAATALYGSQGGNGAIIITTKGAKEDGKGHIEVSHTLSFDQYYNHFDMQKSYGGGSYGMIGARYAADYEGKDTMSPEFLYGEYGGMQNADGSYFLDFDSDESWGARYNKNVMMANANYFDPTSSQYEKAKPFVHGLDLADLFQTGIANTTNIAFSKAGKDYSTRVSFTNSEREGIQQNSDAVRRFLGIKTMFKPTDWLNISMDYKYTYRRDHNGAAEGYGATGNALNSYLQWGHTEVDLKDFKDYKRPDGTWRTWNIIGTDNLNANFHDNPYATFDNINNYKTSRWNVFTGDAEFLLPYNIKAGVRVIGNMKSYNEEQKRNEGSINFSSYYYERQYHTSDLTIQGRATWSDRFVDDRLSVDAAAFVEQRNYNYGTLSANTTNGLIMDGYFNLAGSNGYVSALNEEEHYKTRSLFATATFGFDDTYFLDGSIRNDWDSKLPAANNSFLYGGLSASVMLNQFLKYDTPWLNYWKLRASLAQVGSTLEVYKTLLAYNYTDSDNTNYKYNSLTSLYPSATQLNKNIKPTISTSYEVGTEFRMFENRFWGDFNFYRRDTKNQILNMTVAPQSGYSSRQLNSGLVRNQGIEISLGGTPVKTKDFQWNVDANIAKNNNKLVRLNENIKTYLLEGNSFYYYWYLKANEGKPLGVITTMARWARNEEGLPILAKSTSTAWGGGWAPTYEFNEEKEVGNFQPDWTGGFSTSFRYKNLQVAANFDFMIGGQMVSWTNMWSTGSGTNASTAKLNDRGVNVREPLNANGGVRVDGVDADGNAVTTYMNAYYYYHYKAYYDLDEWVYDRTYVKMRELSVTYDFPKALIAKTKTGLSNASISFVATNPWLVYAACPNVDPSEAGDNWLEGGQAAATRSFGLTVKLGF
ncbi:SusC/RagA family TonB-linked outer membrane protein [Massilibacteroides sp.]|uniref:SusC/RagA family TonB-linked outer membrane protein n=1 Tax=Massilibacteroides sp. TaxID=2034766 RepID=UPI0026070DE6|nr:SusC/RagA family TonB-linked outer membrane protein [Massilibacteroides sp.]MDD4515474.1 SusC/RagA family TonB-linked outer membrane protein [Massilibacteroides sp.]